MKKTEFCIVVVVLFVLAFSICGCAEQQKYGQGELPVGWSDFFGKDNGSRLNYHQSQIIDRHQQVLYGINTRDPNGRLVHKQGLIERLMSLEAENPAELVERVRKVEESIAVDPNEPTLEERIEKLEESQLEAVSEIPKTLDTSDEPLIHCNDQVGCGWGYYECSWHSRRPKLEFSNVDPNTTWELSKVE